MQKKIQLIEVRMSILFYSFHFSWSGHREKVEELCCVGCNDVIHESIPIKNTYIHTLIHLRQTPAIWSGINMMNIEWALYWTRLWPGVNKTFELSQLKITMSLVFMLSHCDGIRERFMVFYLHKVQKVCMMIIDKLNPLHSLFFFIL